MSVEAMTLVTTKYLKGLIADTSIASICSVTFMEPNSAPILEPTLPAQIKAVTNGPKALTMAIPMREGNHELAPKSSSEGRDCLVKTIPTIKPVTVIKPNDLATDTVVFNNIKRSADKLKQITDTANQLVAKLNEASQNPATTLGVLLYNEESGDHVKNIIYNLDSTSYKLNENMEAIQHSFLFRRYFRKKARQATLNVKKY